MSDVLALVQGWKMVLLLWLLLINLLAFALYGIDKRKAIRHQWRISEAHLLLTAAAGGAAGAFLGMHLFHHKTKHLKFVLLVPVFLLGWAVLLYFLYA